MADSKEELICPACGEKMVKIYTKAGMNIDICLNGCGGIWFDNREMEFFFKEDERYEELQSLYSDNIFHETKFKTDRICPVCNKKMVQHKAKDKSDVDIDECYICGGKFLDFGELERIKNSISDEEKITNLVRALNTSNKTKQVNVGSVRNFLSALYQEHAR